jgi:TRAP-type C4-dicarboxylate transport system substrate-binding protein
MGVKRAVMGAAMAVWLASVSGAVAQQFTMRLSSPTINDVTHEWMKAFKSAVETRTAGKMKVEIYPANQLGQIPATVEGVALGTIEFTVPAVGFLTSLDQRFQVLNAPGLFDSVEHGQRTLADPEVRKHLATFGNTKDVEPLITFLNGPMMAASHKPIRAAADFKGQKIRVPGAAPFYVEPFRKLGASPLSMPLGEVLPAMQTRVIDGAIFAFTC